MTKNIFKFISLFAVLSFFSCKKNYTCECSTLISTNAPLGNTETYHVKEKKQEDALGNCSRQYDASGKATGGLYCIVTKD